MDNNPVFKGEVNSYPTTFLMNLHKEKLIYIIGLNYKDNHLKAKKFLQTPALGMQLPAQKQALRS